jgi:type II secretory pathway component GspD/PulD (secretin)
VLVGYSQNNAPIFSKEEERVGIYMQVAASVSSDDNVTLSLYPQVSSVTGFLNVNGASYPQISTREAQTTLRVHTGETIVMGGLMKTEETASYDRVPFLSDLPFLGQLFRHRKETKTASQVIISITPKVIRSDESR